MTVFDSVVKGEYLAWYSENLRLVRCKIIGTQPLCYAKNLVLEDCEMEGADPVSYTHLDVYKRQAWRCQRHIPVKKLWKIISSE